MIAGVDGYRRGWIAAVERGHGRTAVRTYPSFKALRDDRQLTQIVIDIPIGLLERDARACDIEARRLLGRKRSSSVFPAPIRAMLAARSWEEACQILLELEAKRCSKQLWGILPKIREVDEGITPEVQRRVREGHPEVCFAMMNGGKSMEHPKATARGRVKRLALLEPHFPDVRAHLADVPSSKTDIIDAYACLWTARRIINGEAMSFPTEEERDAKGLRAEIVA
jgi:predicted RNase H-like nuclease